MKSRQIPITEHKNQNGAVSYWVACPKRGREVSELVCSKCKDLCIMLADIVKCRYVEIE